MFSGEFMVMNTFVVLGDIDMFSKPKMLKINQTCHQEDFQVRAGSCERYILHRIYKILKNDDFSMFWGELIFMNTFVALRDVNMFSKQ